MELEAIPFEFLDEVFARMMLTPQHLYLILTKRPERMRRYLSAEDRIVRWPDGGIAPKPASTPTKILWAAQSCCDLGAPYDEYPSGDEMEWPLPNVWAGVSVEDQETADERIPILLQTPAAKRFVSAEPLLGPIEPDAYLSREDSAYGPFPGGDPRLFYPDMECCSDEEEARWSQACTEWAEGQGKDRGPSCTTLGDGSLWTGTGYGIGTYRYSVEGLDWLVTAPESGPGRRYCELDWVRSLRDQCEAAQVPFMFKHWYFPHWYHGRKPMSLPLLDGRRHEARP